ncbi:MAG: hypothetical protein WAL71_13820, partial [Terriglobales bacterium]
MTKLTNLAVRLKSHPIKAPSAWPFSAACESVPYSKSIFETRNTLYAHSIMTSAPHGVTTGAA